MTFSLHSHLLSFHVLFCPCQEHTNYCSMYAWVPLLLYHIVSVYVYSYHKLWSFAGYKIKCKCVKFIQKTHAHGLTVFILEMESAFPINFHFLPEIVGVWHFCGVKLILPSNAVICKLVDVLVTLGHKQSWF